MNKILLSLLFFFSISCQASNELSLSKNISINYELPKAMGHFSNILFMKYDTWDFSHERVDPQKIYQTIDLSGVEKEYIKSLFNLSIREDFPRWLAELSKEQASSFAINNDNYFYKKLTSTELYAAYDPPNNRGNIFIIEKNQIHHLILNGAKSEYIALLKAIEER